MARLVGLDLFSGIGGIGEALSPWVRTAAYCEIEPYARALLFSRMKRGEIDAGPVHVDVSRLGRASLEEVGVERLDIIFGGFPCTDISLAGERRGIDSKSRSGLFFQIARLLVECQPTYVMLENVAAIRSMGIDQVVAELNDCGYDARAGVLSAYDVGACHMRSRWWLVGRRRDAAMPAPCHANPGHGIATGCPVCLRRYPGGIDPMEDGLFDVVDSYLDGTWEDGIARLTEVKEHRADRLRLLGNSVFPLCAREVWMRLTGIGGVYGIE